MRHRLHVCLASCLAVFMLSLPSNLAHSKDYKIDSREYKLILDESKLQADPLAAINTLWDRYLKSLIDESIGMKANGSHRYSGSFGLAEERTIRFWDTSHLNKCMLGRHDYSLRERITMVNGRKQDNDREVTLKFRSPDLYLVARTDMKGAQKDAKSKLEEDIVPIVARGRNERNAQQDTDMKPSFRSIYSYSASAAVSADTKLAKIGDLFRLYPALENNLKEDGATVDKDEAMALVSDLSLYERIYDGPRVDLGNVTAKFSVTLWYNQADRAFTAPLIAELTFKYALETEIEKAKRIVLKRPCCYFPACRLSIG